VALLGILVKLADRAVRRPDADLAATAAFRRAAWPLFWLSALVAVALFAVNFHFAILRIGINPWIQLPSNLYVVVAFTVSWGAALWLDGLCFWLSLGRRLSAAGVIYVAALEGLLASLSMQSRAQMLLHTGPVILAMLLQAPLPADRPVDRRGLWLA